MLLRPNFRGEGGSTATGPETRKCEGRSEAVLPASSRGYSSEINTIQNTIDQGSVTLGTRATTGTGQHNHWHT